MTPAWRRLAPGELHVWRASLDQAPDVAVALEAVLSSDERDRALEFRFERDRRRYVAGRGILRILLASYLDTSPAEIAFRYGSFRKPLLDGEGPWFNVSHSGPLALFAFSPWVELGVDVELTSAGVAADRIPEHFFSPSEVRRLRSLPADEQDAAFLACWTRKEAFLKARGDGLMLPLDAFDVGFGPGRPCALLRTAWSTDEPARWRLVDLSDPAAGFVAALAAHDDGSRVIIRQLRTIPVHDRHMTLQEIT